MAYNTKPIITDVDGNPISQYYNKELDHFEPVEGQAGANKVVLYNADGTENNNLSLIPILDKLSQLTGTVIDEETRKSNELQRIELYNQISNMLETGQLKGEKGDKGDTGIGLNFLWQGTSLGVKLETDAEYVFVDLRGPQGPAGDIDNLTSQHIETALGYTPVKSVNNVVANEIGNVELDIDTSEIENRIGNVEDDLAAHKAEKATQEQLGHVKAGNNITIDADGTINAKGGNVDSVNGKTGEVVLSSSDVGAVPVGRTINGKALTSNITIDVSDIAGLVGTRLALGLGASAGISAVALGRDASAVGSSAIALGQNTSAKGSSAIALGLGTSATESYSVALGRGASAGNANEGILGNTGSYATSKWKVPGSFTVSGTKNFEIPHPKPEKKATHVIRHGAVESPTPGDTLYRWRVQASKDNDLVTIDLPDYFVWLNKDVQVFVTPQGHFGNGYGDLNRETEQLEIHCQFAGEYNVLVIGTRNDDHQSVQDWYIKGVEREIGESWTGETYAFSVDEIMEVEEIKEVV